jgi:Domain of unknown function (DUF4268)
MSTPKNLSTLTRVPLREAWKHEAGEFTPWLAQPENLERLADELGLNELSCVATEHRIGDFKLDMLCNDGVDQIIVENQLEETDHKHLGQLISYAAGVEAKKVIWIAESFRPEHMAALHFLNENTTEDLTFFGVQIELWRIGDSALAPKFEIIVKPDNWSKSSREEAKAITDGSPARQLRLRFWRALHAKLSLAAPQIRMHTPTARRYMNSSSLRTNAHLGVAVNMRDERIYVELYLGGDEAKARFAGLLKLRKQIESQLGFELEWMELADAKASRLAIFKEDSSIEDEDRWDEYLDWAVKQLIKMDHVLRPIVKSLP